MSEIRCDVAIVGAGPAGLAAACRAAESGARVTLADDNPRPGGQIWRGETAESRPWLRSLQKHGASIVSGAAVFDAPAPGRLALAQEDGLATEIEYRSLVLATGARERFLPFPGWTLPNVTGAGGLQALAKSGYPVEGKKVVVAGSGPLLLAVAGFLRKAGASVRLVAEQASAKSLARFALSLGRHPSKALQAIRLRAELLGIPYRAGCWVVSAHGAGKIESVTLRQGARVWTEPCDYLACGFGLIPNTGLAQLLGCALSETGVAVDDFQRTSVPRVYCAGEATGIGGVNLALVEGEIAGYAAAGREEKSRGLFRSREANRRFATALENAFALRPELRALPQGDTVLCRCEDVAWGAVRSRPNWRDAKLQTRCGMGPCQGRICGGAVDFLLGWKSESVRPPVVPVRTGNLAR